MRKAAIGPQLSVVSETFEVHEHTFISGPRSTPGYRNSQWRDERKLRHSHPGGSVPHAHPCTGPSSGYRQAKKTAKPTGEQFELVPLSEKQQTFTLVITDSAQCRTSAGGKKKKDVVSIGNTPLEAFEGGTQGFARGFPAAERMMTNCRLKCVVRDEREVR